MNLAAIFQVLEHLNDFEIIGYGGHNVFFFKMRPKMFTGKTLAGQDFPWAVFTLWNSRTNNKRDIRTF